MNKTAILLTSLLLLIVSGYLLYNKYYAEDNGNIWDLVSEDAGLVIEIGKSNKLNDIAIKGLSYRSFSPLINSVIDSAIIDDLATQSYNKLLISFHRISNTSVGLTFFIDLDIQKKSKLLAILTSKDLKTVNRSYLGENINEVEFDREKLHYQLFDNNVILSSYAFLVEDIIRLKNESGINNFKKDNSTLLKFPSLANDFGNMYLNWSRFLDIQNVFIGDNNKISLMSNAFFDVDISEEGWVFNGFSRVSEESFLNTFQDQRPVDNRFDYIIPTNAATIRKYITSDATIWENRLIEYWSRSNPKYLLSRNDFIKKYDFNTDNLFASIDKGICLLEFFDTPANDKLIFIDVKDEGSILNQLNTLAEQSALLENDSVYTEEYGKYLIQELKILNFPMFIMGPEFDGFNTTYYMILDEFLVIGSTIDVLKSLLRNIENENTWGRQKKYSALIDEGLGELNYSYNFNSQQLWPRLMSALNTSWIDYFQKNSDWLKSFGLGSIQFSKIDNNFYTNFIIKKEAKTVPKVVTNGNVQSSLAFNYPIQSRPFVVRNHNTNLLETIIFDSLNSIHLIGSDGKKLWTKSVQGELRNSLKQIDYYNNKKLQYYFTTDSALHIVDRLGNDVENFPLTVDFPILNSSVIDYDNSKKYRFLVTDATGNIYLYSKSGEVLEGWSPFQVTGEHAFTPFHERIRGRDSFIYLLRNGTLNMLTRRAETIDGFPMELEGTFDSDLFIEKGTDYNNSIINLISRSGVHYKINFNGDLLSSTQLIKQNTSARFSLIPDALDKTYLIARQENNRLTILDKKGNELFVKDYLSAGQIHLQFYYFTPEKQLCVITDIEQELTYFYNLEGELLNSQPINSSQKIGLLYSESKDEYTVYSVWDDTFRILKF